VAWLTFRQMNFGERPALSLKSRFRSAREFDAMICTPAFRERGTAPGIIVLHFPEEDEMPVILVPVLWVGGALVLLGGGWYVIGHMAH
jgi:hypothetical protein